VHREAKKRPDKQKILQASRKRHRQAENGTDIQISAQTSREEQRQAVKGTGKQRSRETYRQREKSMTGWQTCRQAGRCKDKPACSRQEVERERDSRI
jgi:hypothetical protein